MGRTLRRLTLAALAITALAPAGASGQVLTGQSGWFWGDPTPQGRSLSDLDFAGSRGYAVGIFGTALRTDDGGATWSGLRTGTTANLSRVQAVDANTVLVGGECTLRRSVDGGATFTRLPFTASESSCPSGISDFDFSDPATGYIALQNGTVIRTADGGRSFSQRTPLPGTAAAGGGGAAVQALAFTGPTTGVAVLSTRVYRTVDGGSTWTPSGGTGGGLKAIDFVSSSTGFVVGESGQVHRTQDGGATFAARPFAGVFGTLTSVDCASADTCLMTVGGGLARTTDAGATASTVSPAGVPLSDAAFANSARAIAVGQRGTTVLSNDGGANFSAVGAQLAGNFGFLRSTGQRVYAPGSAGRVARSLDGGRSWSSFAVSTSSGIADVSFPTPAIGFALDDSGGLQRTDNAGDSWQILNTGTSSDPSALTVLDGRQVILIGPRGVRRSGDGGQSFSAVGSRAVRRAALSDFDRAGGAVFAFGSRALALSTNGGRSWRALRRPRGRIADVDFVSSRVGFLRTTAGRLYRTANRGRRWREVLTGTNRMGDLGFADARRGWIAGTSGADVLRTTDGGRSWQPQEVTENGLSSIVALSGTAAAAFDGREGRFYATTGGGAIGAVSRLSISPSRRLLRRTTRVRLRGRLRPARGGELVSVLSRTGTRWSRRNVRAAANGTFTLTYRVRRSTVFVAQWAGDDRSAGDGTAAVRVTVKKRKRRRR